MATVAPPQPAARLEIFEGFDAVTLSAGDLEATFLPEVGMLGASLRHRGEELLHRGAGLRAYRERGELLGIPLLHPWANRLSADGYALHGRRVRLDRTPARIQRDERGLPIHGLLAAHRGWRLGSIDAGRHGARLEASLDLGADPALSAAFPFPHVLTIAATVADGALTIATTVEPTGGAPVPVAFGFHPYLRLPGADRRDWVVSFPRRRRVLLDRRGIPTGERLPAAARAFRLGNRTFDDGFDRIADGAAFSASGGGRTITVRHDAGFPVAQVYSPPGAQFVCLEPMTAPVDALRTGDGLRRASERQPFTATFTIAVGSG